MSRTSASAKALRFAITGVIAAGMLSGCAGSKHLARAGEHAARVVAQHDRAVEAAEARVRKFPEDVAARVALGQAYLDAGRFDSAATTFADAVTLGDESGATQLRLALARIGAGDLRSALIVLDDEGDAIPASDRGLALALAGETGRGVHVLLDALRAGENTPKLRQNLAFAYALDGQWREARIVMGQDVPADQIGDRISDWAMMSRPEDVQRRVASLLGVPAGVADAGQPEALALGAAPEPAEFAAEDAAGSGTVSSGAETAVAELPPLDSAPEPLPVPAAIAAPAEPAPIPADFNAAFAASQPSFVSRPVVQKIPAPRAYSAEPARRAPRAAVKEPPRPVAKPTHRVQLGSFSSEASARRAIRVLTVRNPELRDLELTITPAVVNGKNFWRVAAAGLDRSGARSLCSGVKNRGGACFAYAATNAPAGGQPALALNGAGLKARRR